MYIQLELKLSHGNHWRQQWRWQPRSFQNVPWYTKLMRSLVKRDLLMSQGTTYTCMLVFVSTRLTQNILLTTWAAHKTFGMVQVVHGLTCFTGACHSLPTLKALTYKIRGYTCTCMFTNYHEIWLKQLCMCTNVPTFFVCKQQVFGWRTDFNQREIICLEINRIQIHVRYIYTYICN